MLVDSHCHLNMLDLTAHQGDLQKVLDAAKAQGVGHILCVSTEIETFPIVLDIARRYENVSASVGLHPTEAVSREPTVDDLVKLGNDAQVIAVGETGLDYYHCKDEPEWQRERFRTHIHAAIKLGKPLIIHTRDAREDTVQILKEEHADKVGGIFHCFTENWEMAQQGLDLGFYISFSGIVTFKNATSLKEIAKQVPLDRMLIETDAPFLAPMPFRGKPNEPAYVRYVAEHIAELRNESYEVIASKTTENFFRLFKLKRS